VPNSDCCSKLERLELGDAIALLPRVPEADEGLGAASLDATGSEVSLGGISTGSCSFRADLEKGCLPATSLLRKLELDDL